MSQSSVARWNAIPMTRPEESGLSLKRKRQEDEMNTDADDDDDISLVSRSPSPVDESMDVDPESHISKYDEFVRGPAREVITTETKIKSTNKGFAMLAKMGWAEGKPLGMSPDGRVDPIPFEIKRDSTGLGKTSQDVRMIEETVSQRRELDSERQTKESEEQRKARENAVARQAAVQNEISSTLRPFYCSLCDKQFKNVAQYDEHTNSYAHHHKARFKDMQASARLKPQDEIDKRKEKERKREERELRKIAAASGVKMPKTVSQATPPPVAAVTADTSSVDSNSVQKKGGWASVGATSVPSSSTGFKKSGWATVGPSPPPSSTPPPPPSEPPAAPSLPRELPTLSSFAPPPPPSTSPHSHTTSFRTGGWTSLDTTTQPAAAPSPPTPFNPPPPPPPLPQSMGGWPPTPAEIAAVRPPHPSSSTSAPPPKPPPVPSAPAEPKLSGWQKFQAKNTKRK